MPAKRPNRQQISAAATRQEILRTARRLFAERGYALTSVADLAQEAGVSLPTIYSSVGPKHAIVMALVEFLDFQAGGPDARSRADTVTDPAELIGIGAHLNRVLQENFGDILDTMRSAAQIEPAVASANANGHQMHRFGASRLAERLEQLAALRPDVTVDEAADVIAHLTDVDTFSALTDRYGWSFDRAEAWITATLRATLLRDPSISS